MEALEEQQQQQQDVDAAGVPQQPASSELDHAATATSNRGDASAAGGLFISRSIVSTARKEEVQRLLCQVLVIPCELSAQYAAPVIIMSQEDSNIYTVLERHLKRDYLMGAEKFWRLVRAELGVDTWRPRVQGTQLKALQGARLPELEQEFQEMQRMVTSLQECIMSDSSPEALIQDLRLTIKQIQNWWEQRNRRPDGEHCSLCCHSAEWCTREGFPAVCSQAIEQSCWGGRHAGAGGIAVAADERCHACAGCKMLHVPCHGGGCTCCWF